MVLARTLVKGGLCLSFLCSIGFFFFGDNGRNGTYLVYGQPRGIRELMDKD
jgi:hypothetical protein